MSELGGVGIRTCYCDLHSGRWGPGGDKIPMDFGSNPDSECSNPPTSSLLHRGDPEISMCMPFCRCVQACCGGSLWPSHDGPGWAAGRCLGEVGI